jgi:hypothetical protein
MKKIKAFFLLAILPIFTGFWNIRPASQESNNRPSMKKEDMMANEQPESHPEVNVINLSEQFISGVTGTVYVPGLTLRDKDKNTN